MSGRASTPKAMLLVFACVLVVAGTLGLSPQEQRKWNVLFIAVDDLNNDLGCYGDPIARTPNIDRLAARGVRFDRAYCQYPLCNPTRTSLLSGRRPDTTRILDNNSPPRTYLKDVVFLPEHFRAQGYFTARVGKIAHGKFEDAVKWDVSENARPGPAASAVRRRDRRLGGQQGRAADGTLNLEWQPTDNKDDDEPDGNTARRIAQLLEQNKDRTFFIAAGFHKPHLPWVAPKKYFDMFPPEKMPLPQVPPDDTKDIPSIALPNSFRRDVGMTDDQKRKAKAAYYACVSFMDAQVGVVLDALDRLKLVEKTIVVFWGDHGFHLGEHYGLWRKMSLFEESARVPLIVAVPWKQGGAASPRLVEFVDIYPTLTELCGLPVPDGLEGASFVSLLSEPNRPWKKAAFTVVARGRGILGRTVRTERYRYTEWGGEKYSELYDHRTDPHEYTNLAGDPIFTKTLAELRSLLKAGWRAALPPPN